MKKQEIFNQVWDWFVIKKNRRSAHADNNMCLYRGPRGAKCAVGCLIPDEMANRHSLKKLNADVELLFERYPEIKKFLGGQRNWNFLDALQSVHDGLSNKTFKREIEKELRKVAKEFRVKIPVFN